MKRLQQLLFFILLATASAPAAGQGASAIAWADTTTIRIGEQLKLNLELTVPSSGKVRFPAFPDTLNQFEIVSKSRIDTTDNKNNTLTYKQQLVLTGFDSGYFVIQPVTFFYKDIRNAGF